MATLHQRKKGRKEAFNAAIALILSFALLAANGETNISYAIQQGTGASAWQANDIAIGDNSKARSDYYNMPAIAIGSSALANSGAPNTVAIGTVAKSLGNRAVALGAASEALERFTVSLGWGAGLEAHSANSTFVGTGAGSNIYGSNNVIIGSYSTGNESNTAAATTRARILNVTNTVSLGNGASAEKNYSTVLGDSALATIQEGDVAIGSKSQTYAVTSVNSMTINGTSYALAGGVASSAVSVGTTDSARQIQNVAAGRVSSTSTDAVNGSQLYAATQAINKLGTTVGQGMTFAGNDGAVTKQLGDTLAVKGDALTTGTYSSGNIRTEATADGIKIKLADAPVFTGKVKASGFDASGAKVENVAIGIISSTSTDAINGSQLYSSLSSVASSLGTTVNNGLMSPLAYKIGMATYSSVGDALSALNRQAGTVVYVTPDGTRVYRGTDGKFYSSVNPDGSGVGAEINQATLHHSLVNPNGSVTSVSGSVLGNVGAGRIAVGSQEAINGSQLYDTRNATAQMLGTIVNPDGSFVNPSYTVGTASYNTVAGAISALNTLSASPIAFQGDSGTKNVSLGESLKISGATVAGHKNITTAAGVTGVEIAMSETPQFGSVQVNANNTGKISGVADGTAAGDAVNKAQMDAAVKTVSDAAAANDAGAVKYDSATAKDKVTLGGTSSTTPVLMTNLQNGAITSISKDAINGSQLYSSLSSVATALGTTVNNGVMAPLTYNIGTITYHTVGDALSALNRQAGTVVYVTPDGTRVFRGTDGKFYTRVNSDGSGDGTAIEGATLHHSLINPNGDVATAAGSVLGNVGAGRIAADSHEAVNGSQLYDTRNTTAQMLGTTLNPDGSFVNPSYTVGGSSYSNVAGALSALNTLGTSPITFQGDSGTKDVKLGEQLKISGATVAGHQNITTAAGVTGIDIKMSETPRFGSVKINADGTGRIAGVTAATEGDEAVNKAQMDAAVKTVSDAAAANDAAAVKYDSATTKDKVTLGGVGSTTPVLMTNLQNGAITSTSTDAINGSQIRAIANSIAAQLGGNATADATTGAITKPTYYIGAGTYNSVGDAFAAVNRQAGTVVYVAPDGTRVFKGTDGNFYSSVDSSGVGMGTAISQATLHHSLVNPDGSVTSVSGSGSVLGNVGAGKLDTDAVNVSQLKGAVTALGGGAEVAADGTVTAPSYQIKLNAAAAPTTVTNVGDALTRHENRLVSVEGSITALGTSPITFTGDTGSVARVLGSTLKIHGTTADPAKTYSANNITTSVENDSIVIKMSESPVFTGKVFAQGVDAGGNTITNVKAGTADTDAVNKKQLDTVAAAATASDASSVKYDGADKNHITLGGIDAVSGQPAVAGGVTISNVKAGEISSASTQAINGAQLYQIREGLTTAGFALKDTAGNEVKQSLGGAIAVVGDGSNITTAVSGGALKVSMSATPVFGTLKINDGGAGKISGLTAGTAAGDAVNVGQISPLATALGITPNAAGVYGTPTYNVAGATYHTVGDAMGAINTQLTKGLVVSANEQTPSVSPTKNTINLGDTIDISTNNQNLTIALDGSKYTVGMVNSPTFTGKVSAVGFDAGGAKITNLAPGAVSTDAVTYGQVAGWISAIQVSGMSQITLSSPMVYATGDGSAGSPIVMVRRNPTDNKFYSIDSFNSDGSLKPGSVEITTPVYISTINPNGSGPTTPTRLANIEKGTAPTDAVNVSQLTGTLETLGGGAGLAADGSIIKPTYNMMGDTYNNVGEVFNALNRGIIGTVVYTDKNGVRLVKVGSDFYDENMVNHDGSLKPGAAITPGADVKLSAVDKDGNITGTGAVLGNIAAGVTDTDAVNLKQLKATGVDLTGEKPVVTYDAADKKAVTFGDTATNLYDPITKTGGVKLTNIADATAPSDAVNKSQLDTVSAIAENANKGWKLSANGGTAETIAPDETINVAQGSNMVVTRTGKTLTVATSETPKFGTLEINKDSSGKISGLTAGTLGTDAVNKAQMDTAIKNLSTAAATAAEGYVKYDDPALKNTVTFGGTGSTTPVLLTNIKDGAIKSDSSDAVNGSQIRAIADSIAAQFGGGAIADPNTGAITKPTYHIGSIEYHSVGDAFAAVNRQAGTVVYVTPDGTRVYKGTDNNFYSSIDSTTGLGIGDPIDQKTLHHSLINPNGDVATAAGSVLGNVGAGRIAEDSHEAVNGSQLYDTRNATAAMLGTTLKADGSFNDPSYTVAGKSFNNVAGALSALNTLGTSPMTFLGDSGTKNVALGEQLKISGATVAGHQNITTAAGVTGVEIAMSEKPQFGSVKINSDGTGRIAGITTATEGDEAVNKAQMDAAVKAVADAATTNDAGAVKYDDAAAKDKVTLGGTGSTTPVLLTNLQNGAITSTSTDAVNGSQIRAIANSIAAQLGGKATADPVTGAITSPTYTIGKGTYSNVGDAFAAVNRQAGTVVYVTPDGKRVFKGTDDKFYLSVDSSGVGQGTPIEQATLHHSLVNPDGTVASASGSGSVLGNVGAGRIAADSHEAVNGSQLYDTRNATAAMLGTTLNTDGSFNDPSYTVGGKTFNNVAGALSELNTLGTSPMTFLGESGSKEVKLGESLKIRGAAAPGGHQNITTAASATGIDIMMSETPQFGNVKINASGTGKISGVADATAGDEAVNKAQMDAAVKAVADAATTNDAGAVKYDDPAAKDKVTLGGTGSTTPVLLTNLKNGAITSTSTDAVNGSQIRTIADSIAAQLGGKATADPITGAITAPTYAIGKGEYSNVGDAFAAVNRQAGTVVYVTPDGKRVFKGTDDKFYLSVNTDGSGVGTPIEQATLHHSLVNPDGTVTSASGSVLGNIGAGRIASDSHEAVNGSQLYDTRNLTAQMLGTTVNDDGTFNTPSYTVGGTSYNNVAGALSALNTQGTSPMTFTGDSGSKNVALGETLKISGKIVAGHNNITTTAGADGIDIAISETPQFGSIKINRDGTGRISGLANAEEDSDAVNYAQLKALSKELGSVSANPMTFEGNTGNTARKLGETLAIKGEGNIVTDVTADGVKISMVANPSFAGGIVAGNNNKVNVNNDDSGTITGLTNKTLGGAGYAESGRAATEEQLKLVDDKISQQNTTIDNLDKTAVRYDNTDKKQITLGGGASGEAVKLTNVAEGTISENSKDAVTGSQLYTTNQAVATLSTQVGALQAGGSWSADVETATDSNGTATGDATAINRAGKMTYSAGNNMALNIETYGNGNGRLTIAMQDNPEFKGKVTAKGFDASGEKITNVKAGELSAKSTDAVNGSQLYSTNQELKAFKEDYSSNWSRVSSYMNKMDGKIGSVGAMSAAMSAMVPLDFNEEYRTMITAGLGNYSGESAIALGIMHYANRDLLLNGGVSWSSDEQMYRLGATLRLGKSRPQTRQISPTEQKALQEVSELRETVQELLKRVSELESNKN